MVDPRPKRRLDRRMKATLFALFVALLMVGSIKIIGIRINEIREER